MRTLNWHNAFTMLAHYSNPNRQKWRPNPNPRVEGFIRGGNAKTIVVCWTNIWRTGLCWKEALKIWSAASRKYRKGYSVSELVKMEALYGESQILEWLLTRWKGLNAILNCSLIKPTLQHPAQSHYSLIQHVSAVFQALTLSIFWPLAAANST